MAQGEFCVACKRDVSECCGRQKGGLSRVSIVDYLLLPHDDCKCTTLAYLIVAVSIELGTITRLAGLEKQNLTEITVG